MAAIVSKETRLYRLLRRVYRTVMGGVMLAQLCWALFEVRIHGLRVDELQPGEAARAQDDFGVSGTQPRPTEWLDQASGQIGIVVAWLGRRPVGIGFVAWHGVRSEVLRQRWPGVPEIYRLWVQPRYRSVGIGTAIVQHMEGQALARGLSHVGLGVHESNLRARALYLRLGYQPDPLPYIDSYLKTAADGSSRQVDVSAVFLVKDLAGAGAEQPGA